MAWGPFKSAAEVDAERRVKLLQGKMAIREYLKHTLASSIQYREMAKKALALDQTAQARQYAMAQLQYENQRKRWESFELKLKDIELRGVALKAMGSLMNGLDGLVKSINKGLSLPAMEKTMVELQAGMIKVDAVEQQLASHMENLTVNVGPESLPAAEGDVPEEMRAEVDRLCASLMDEVVMETEARVQAKGGKEAKASATTSELEDRMADQIQRLRRLRQGGGKR